jgi:outer membrane lipoprotein-sorting protein
MADRVRSAPSRLRWLAPPLVAGVIIGGIGLLPRLASAEGQPNLPALTPQQLVDKVQATRVDAFSGTLRLSTHLGLPDLGSLADAAGAAGTSSTINSTVLSLVTGSHSARVWMDGPDHMRVALPSGLAETDFIRNGADVWQWQSTGMQVTHTTITKKAPVTGSSAGASTPEPATAEPANPTTPGSAAKDFLDSINPSTRVSVRNTAFVAGRPVYELVLSPRSGQTLVADVVIAVDSATGLPLRVQVLGRNQTTPAIEFGFTSISLQRPAASTFSFTPPPGSVVNAPTPVEGPRKRLRNGARAALQVPVPESGGAPGSGATPTSTQTVGDAWDSILIARGTNVQGSVAGLLAKATTPVSGAWGHGRLLSTSLVNVLFDDDGRILAGAVTPEALEAAAASTPVAAPAAAADAPAGA